MISAKTARDLVDNIVCVRHDDNRGFDIFLADLEQHIVTTARIGLSSWVVDLGEESLPRSVAAHMDEVKEILESAGYQIFEEDGEMQISW